MTNQEYIDHQANIIAALREIINNSRKYDISVEAAYDDYFDGDYSDKLQNDVAIQLNLK